MDIFTTQLTRVVPVPIKPANLKVKALLKEAGTGKLKEDPDHLENHDYYCGEKKSEHEATDEKNESTEKHADASEQDNKPKDKSKNGLTESADGVQHLDIYI